MTSKGGGSAQIGDTFEIGDWVMRRGTNMYLNHKVESIINGAAITKCGRRMEPFDGRGRGLERFKGMIPTWRCERCS